MTGKKRNAFEKELQRDSFSEEALDGLGLISPEDAAEDIDVLYKKLNRRITGNKKFIYYRIAASVAVIMIISSVFIIINRYGPEQLPNDNFPEKQTVEILKSPSFREPPVTKQKSVSKTVPVNKNQVMPGNEKNISEMSKTRPAAPGVPFEKAEKTAVSAEIQTVKTRKPAGIESREIKAMADSQVEAKLNPVPSTPSKMGKIGYGSKRSRLNKNELSENYLPPRPLIGKQNFDKYILDNLQRPDSATEGQRLVVVVSILVHTNGQIDSIKIIRSPGKKFSDEAIRLIRSGPSWIPAEENGKSVEDEVRVSIVFPY